MAKTYAQLNAQIEVLRAKADAARRKEVAGVITRIKVAIAHYGLTANDLGLANGTMPPPTRPKSPAKGSTASKTPGQTRVSVKYRDQAGNSWSGRGSRPRWLAAALAAGQSIESFAVNGTGAKAAPAPKRSDEKSGSRSKSKSAPAAKYRDGANSWSGRGPKPGWVKQALAAGKALDDLRS